MILPTTYFAALMLSIFTMLCWGSWANTQKVAGLKWRSELFYFDYSFGVFLCALIACFTFGSINETELTFRDSLLGIAYRKVAWALASGVIFNIANVLLVSAIAMTGMSVAFPIAIGLALIVGVVWNFFLNPQANPTMLFGGVVLVAFAIVVDAIAYRTARTAKRVVDNRTSIPVSDLEESSVNPNRNRRKTRKGKMSPANKGIAVSLISGLLMGSFYPLIQIAMTGEGMALPAYTAGFFFSIGILLSTFIIVPVLMNFPLHGKPVEFGEYFAGTRKQHILGILGGIIWFAGTIANLVASSAPKSANVGPAVSYALGQGATLISAFWGLFYWKEFKDAPPTVNLQLGAMIALFIAGLTLISLAPKY
jgi:glucose uptake protein